MTKAKQSSTAKPKPLGAAAERSFRTGAETVGLVLTARQCRDVLAALSYERQRAQESTGPRLPDPETLGLAIGKVVGEALGQHLVPKARRRAGGRRG